CMQGKQLPNSF
nr:immunoglobulin light chain junction region [Macaca mulatta]